MKHRRNFAVAAVTAAVVTTALVGTTLPGLVADRTSDDSIVEQATDQALSAETLVRTDLPEVPSADDISTARESQHARDRMMVDIVGRIDQAVDRADELELELMRQHSLAQARLQDAADLQQEAEDASVAAEAALAMEASEEYQDDDTSAADVLLGDDDALADDATGQQLSTKLNATRSTPPNYSGKPKRPLKLPRALQKKLPKLWPPPARRTVQLIRASKSSTTFCATS